MKSWLAKFRISSALDSGAPLAKSLRDAISADPELEKFTRRSEALGRALKKPPMADASMHQSIMRAVRASAQEEQRSRPSPFMAWAAASTVLAAVVLICFFTFRHQQMRENQRPLEGAVAVLEASEHISATVPSYMMAPLSNELARVDRNLQDTTHVLLASFP